MTDRERAIKVLLEAADAHPEMRLGQIIGIIGHVDPFYLTDAQFADELEQWMHIYAT